MSKDSVAPFISIFLCGSYSNNFNNGAIIAG